MVLPKARRPKTRTRSRKLAVFKDDTADSDDDDNAENKPPGPSIATTTLKRKLLPPPGSGGGLPQPKRQALGDKSHAANSRDSSLRVTKRESPIKETRTPSPPPPPKKEPRVLVAAETAEPEPSSAEAPAAAIELSRHLDSHSSTTHQLQSLVDEERVQEAADLIAAKGLWTPGLVAEFGTTPILTLDLSSPSASSFSTPKFQASQLLAPLFVQHRFTALTTVLLRNTFVSADDVALLRVLPALATLDLCATGLTNPALYHLVCHGRTLASLNIANNEDISDEVRPVFAALPRLAALYLRGTGFSLPALRLLVSHSLPAGCRLLSMPAPAIHHLNSLHTKYCVDIPDGYIADPAQLESGDSSSGVQVLKKNLGLHAKYNRDVLISGSKADLVHRLRALLLGRQADLKLISVLGRQE